MKVSIIVNCCGVSEVAFTCESKTESPFTSTPIALSPKILASTSVVPEPQKGSSIVCPFIAYCCKILFGNWGGNFAG